MADAEPPLVPLAPPAERCRILGHDLMAVVYGYRCLRCLGFTTEAPRDR